MKHQNNKEKGNVFTLLIRNYVVFTVLLIVLMIIISVTTVISVVSNLVNEHPLQLNNYYKQLTEGNFDEIPIKKILGRKGQFVIVDEIGNKVYGSEEESLDYDFNENEIKCIQNYIEDSNVTIHVLNTDAGENVSVSVRTVKDDETYYKEYIIDKNHKVLYQSFGDLPEELTEREYKLLTNNYYEDYNITKVNYKDKNSNDKIMMLYQSKDEYDILIGKISSIFFNGAMFFIVGYCILIMIFIFWLKNKICNPLETLCNALKNFDREHKIEYSGPKEFVQIFTSYNDLSDRLAKSEQERIRIENDKCKMLADISHDLKTPITVTQGYAEALIEGVIPKEQTEKYLEIIVEKTKSLNTLINTFYEYNKMEHPDYKMDLESVDICVYFRNYIADRYQELELQGINMDVDIVEDHINCNINTMQLKRVFDNIIGNAIKYNTSDMTLFFKLFKHGDTVKIILADNGKGIPVEIQKTIFEPFVTGEKSKEKSDSGLGLSIVKRIINAQNGEIYLVENPQEIYKTEFDIYLPVAEC